jgi:hypothetical protein
MKIEEGTEVVFKGKWWIVQEFCPSYDGIEGFDEVVIVDEDGEEKVAFVYQIDTVLPSFS